MRFFAKLRDVADVYQVEIDRGRRKHWPGWLPMLREAAGMHQRAAAVAYYEWEPLQSLFDQAGQAFRAEVPRWIEWEPTRGERDEVLGRLAESCELEMPSQPLSLRPWCDASKVKTSKYPGAVLGGVAAVLSAAPDRPPFDTLTELGVTPELGPWPVLRLIDDRLGRAPVDMQVVYPLMAQMHEDFWMRIEAGGVGLFGRVVLSMAEGSRSPDEMRARLERRHPTTRIGGAEDDDAAVVATASS